jgi:hypothetical protein
MKRLKIFYLFLSLINFNATVTIAQNAKNNDLVKYGLKGEVKTMQQVIYSFCRKVNGAWVATDTPYYTIKTYTYSKTGMLQSIEEKRIDNRTHRTDITTTRMLYKNDKLAGSEWYDRDGKKMGSSEITWQTNYSYVDAMEDKKNENKIETYHILDSAYRNKETNLRKYGKHGIEDIVNTRFKYSEGVFTGEDVTDSMRNATMSYKVETLSKDNMGNANEGVMYAIPYKENIPAIITFYTYEYYDK